MTTPNAIKLAADARVYREHGDTIVANALQRHTLLLGDTGSQEA